MVNVIVSTAGTSGPRGNSLLSGTGAPSNSLGFDGDWYLDTLDINKIYGPKAGGVWPAPVEFGGIAKNNLIATVPPTISDDSSLGYAPGSVWINTTTKVYYVNSFAGVNAAVWTPVLPVGTVAGTVAAGDDSRIVSAIQPVDAATTVVSETSYGQSPDVGITFTYAREDHTHGTPSLTTGFGPLVLPLAIGTVGIVGTSADAAHADHTHFMANAGTPTTSAVGDAPVIGSSTLFSASNHVHGRESFGGVETLRTFPQAASDGVLASVSHSDHDHGLPGLPNATSAELGVVQLVNDLSGTATAPTVVNTHLSSPLPINQGGTGSSTQNFVDLTTTQSVGGTKTFTGEIIVPTPVNGGDATTKNYVDAASSGLSIKGSCIVATTVALPANTYNNGSSGVGATLTGNVTGTLTVDGHLVATNDRILVKNEAAPANNGIYVCTTAGAVGVAYVLTRSTDMDQATEIKGAYTFITGGSVNVATSWVVTDPGPFIVGTTAIDWTQFSSSAVYTGGTGINVTGTVINLVTPVDAANLPSATTSAYGITKFDGNAADIQPLGVQSAGSTGLTADAGHVHPTTGVVLTANAATTVQDGTTYGVNPAVGTALTYAREDHSHGTPSLTNSPPSVVEGIGQVAVLGVATTPARADHVHPLATAGTPSTSNPGNTTQVGVLSTFAASDHVHGRESFGSVTAQTTYGLGSTTGVATSISHSDHTHGTPSLTTLAPSTTLAIGTAAALGTATTPSLADHVHPMASAGTPTTSAVGDSPVTGNATTFAASNHVHGREAFGAVTALSAFNTPSSNGTATTVSHSDHVHGAPALPNATSSVLGVIQLTSDLAGTAVSPTVAKINGTSVPANPVGGQVLTATSSTTATWQNPTTSGAAGGDLSGTYPNPTVAKVNGVSVTGTPVANQNITATSSTAATWTVLPHMASSGILSGAVMTFSSGATFNVSAGTGYVVDYVTSPSVPVITSVTISAQSVTLTGAALTRVVNWWLADSAGVITSQATAPSPTQRRTAIVLGTTWSVTGTGALYNVMSAPTALVQPTASLFGFMAALGTFSVTGNAISANGSNLNINKSAGTLFAGGFGYGATGANNPNQVTSPAETAATFRYVTQLTNSESATTTVVDVSKYDSGGVITNIPGAGSPAAIHRVFVLPTGVSGSQIVIQYGQATYGSVSTATAAIGTEPFVLNPDIDKVGVLLCYLVAAKNATNLSNTGQATFRTAANFALP